MRILHLSSEHPPQPVFGLGRYVCDLSRELARQGHQVHVLTNSISGLDQDVIDQGVHLHRVDYPPPPKPPGEQTPALAFNLHLQQRATALGRDALGNPEVVVSHDWLTALAGHRVARRWGIPHVWTVHDTIVGKTFGRYEGREETVIYQIERWAARTADLVLVNSSAIGEEVIQHYQSPPQRTTLLHCAIDVDRYSLATPPNPMRLAMFRHAFASPDEALITYVGRLDIEKGIDTLINAFAVVHQQIPTSRLAIIGIGRLEGTIRKHIEALSLGHAVELYGYLHREALRHLYRISDLHVCPSHYEPFGLVVAEAMAAGRPVVATATGGLVDIISTPEVGRLVPPRQHEAMANAMIDLLRDPAARQRMGDAAARHIRDHFTWTTMATKAAEIYHRARLAS